MGTGAGIFVMIGVPKKPVVVSGSVFVSVIDVDIYGMHGCSLSKLKPPSITGSQIVEKSAIDKVILIVVMGNQPAWALVLNGFMVRVEISKMSPAVFVYQFPFFEKRVATLDDSAYILEVALVGVIGLGDEIGNCGCSFNPLRLCEHMQRVQK
jgi:hypothetical protein